MDKEIWKPVKGFEDCYEVSSIGRFKSLTREVKSKSKGSKTIKGQLIKQHIDRGGYLKICLWKKTKMKNQTVHRLVCEAFIPNPENKKFINHKNGIKTDNRIENLEWCTMSENMQHAHKTGLASGVKGEKNHNSVLTAGQVKEILTIGGNLKQYEIAEIYGINRRHVSRILSNKRWQHINI